MLFLKFWLGSSSLTEKINKTVKNAFWPPKLNFLLYDTYFNMIGKPWRNKTKNVNNQHKPKDIQTLKSESLWPMPGTLPSSTSHKLNIFFPLLFLFTSFYCSYRFFLFVLPIFFYIYNKSKQNISYGIEREAVAFFMYVITHIHLFPFACSPLCTHTHTYYVAVWRVRAPSTRIIHKAEKTNKIDLARYKRVWYVLARC